METTTPDFARDFPRAVAAAYALGGDPHLTGGPERGQRGQVWQLTTSRGLFAVKESFEPPDRAAAEEDAAYQDAVRASGVAMPAVVRTTAGEVLAEAADTIVRVYECIEIRPPDRSLDPAAVGRAVAAIHAVEVPCLRSVDPWHTQPVGGPALEDLAERAAASEAPFAEALTRLVPEFTHWRISWSRPVPPAAVTVTFGRTTSVARQLAP